jgi:hypothetical protein
LSTASVNLSTDSVNSSTASVNLSTACVQNISDSEKNLARCCHKGTYIGRHGQ